MDPPTAQDGGSPDTSSKNEAFQLLSDRTRLEILQVLWEAYDPTNPSPLRFADIRDRIRADDPGRINYHLDQLTTHFVRRTDAGYELREAGKRIVRMLLSGTALDNPELKPVEVDVPCWYCDGQPVYSYRDGWRYLECTDCNAQCFDTIPQGVLLKSEFPPSGLQNRTPNEIKDADRIWDAHRRATVLDRVCPECAGDMPITSIDICEDHHPNWDEYQCCTKCGSVFRIIATHICESCKYDWNMPTRFYAIREPAVTAFYYDYGIEFDLATNEQRSLILDFEEELLSMDPLRLRISISLDGEQLRLRFDSRMNVIDITRDEEQTLSN